MSQDIVADGLNMMMNALRAGKNSVVLTRNSKLLLDILAIAKLKNYLKSYSAEGKNLNVEFNKLNFCQAIKPRFMISPNEIEKYKKRYLPAKDFGVIIISTSQGLMTHQTAIDKKIGGSLIAYFY